MAKKQEPENNMQELNIPSPEETIKVFGSQNILMPLTNRITERLKELKALGKPEFHKDENKEWQTIEPKMPIAGAISWATSVRKISPEEYTITYDVYETDSDNKVVMIPVIAGPGDMGLMHKVIGWRVTETFKKGSLMKTEKKRMEDSTKLRRDYENKMESYQRAREEKIKTR